MEKKKLDKKKRIALIVGCSILGLILVILLTVLIWGKSLLGLVNRIDGSEETLSAQEAEDLRNQTDPDDPNFKGPSYNASDVTMPTDPADTIEDGKNIINILLVGQDRSGGTHRQRSDAMILCTINRSEKTLTMTSFMRDLWVRIPGYYDERLNVPYAIAGFPLLNETLEYQFGVTVDHNVEVDFSGFERVVDMLGGIDISLSAREASHLNLYTSWGLREGVNHLNGKQALEYSRIRAIDSDFNRTNRQRVVLNTIVEGVRNLSAKELYAFAESILPIITTDMTDTDIMHYIMTLTPILPELEVKSQRIPMEDAYSHARIDGKAVLVLSPENLEKNKELLQQTLGE